MSVDRRSPPPATSARFKSQTLINVNPHKQIEASISFVENNGSTKTAIKTPTKEVSRSRTPSLRPGSSSASEETLDRSADVLKLPNFDKVDAKREKRISETRSPATKNRHQLLEQRHSMAATHITSLLPHGLRFNKNHQRNNSKDETNIISITIEDDTTSDSISPIHTPNVMGTTTEPFMLAKPASMSGDRPRLPSWSSNERLMGSPAEDPFLQSSLFVLDESPTEPRSAELSISEFHASLYVSEMYRNHFSDHFHINYYGELVDESQFIASLRVINYKTVSKETSEARLIIRTPENNYDVSEILTAANENNILRTLFGKATQIGIAKVKPIGDPKANEKIYLFDKTNDERCNCKIGVIYQRSNQTNEQDIFNNDSLPPDMADFLGRISKRVDLKGFQKYRGDLDTKNGAHGEYSYHAEFKNHEIMFNVAPMIPSIKAEERYIIRKGLVGNAFVCVVFQEPGAIFSPDFISGRVTQIYITVQPLTKDKRLHYKVGIWRRNDIKKSIDPTGGFVLYDESFCPYFLTLLLNSIDTAIKSPNLRSLIFEQRRRLKSEELKKLISSFSVNLLSDFHSEIDNSLFQSEGRSNSRTDSAATSTTSATSDSSHTNQGRQSPPPPKRKSFSKFFGVFTSRSGSVPSTTYSAASNSTINEGLSDNDSTAMPDDLQTLSRTIFTQTKENLQKMRSLKPDGTPAMSPRLSNAGISSSQRPLNTIPANSSVPDRHSKQTNLINPAALDIVPRSRSNSSPEDIITTNKLVSLSIPRKPEHILAPSTDEAEGSEESSSDTEF